MRTGFFSPSGLHLSHFATQSERLSPTSDPTNASSHRGTRRPTNLSHRNSSPTTVVQHTLRRTTLTRFSLMMLRNAQTSKFH